MWARSGRSFSYYCGRFPPFLSLFRKLGIVRTNGKRSKKLRGKCGRSHAIGSTLRSLTAMRTNLCCWIVILILSLSSCGHGSKGKRPGDVRTIDSTSAIVVIDETTDLEKLQGWTAVPPGKWHAKQDAIDEAQAQTKECLDLLGTDDPAPRSGPD